MHVNMAATTMKVGISLLCLAGLLWMVTCHRTSSKTDDSYINTPRSTTKKNALRSTCNFPPSVWCSSRKIARDCQVESQCEKFVWLKSQGNTSAVHFTLYIEALCPDCKQFIVESVWPVWKKLHPIMDLEIVPYGNAEETLNGTEWKFTCQHGPDECVGNIIETCAIHQLKDAVKYFPFIHCIEKSDDNPALSAPRCAKLLNIDYKSIDTCSKSSLGNKLEHEMAVKTDNLKPPHQFVPWVTLNGVHTDEIQQEAISNLLKLICDTYKGKKPSACKKQLNVHRKKKMVK